MAGEKSGAGNAGHVDDQVGLRERMVARALGKLALGGDAAFAENALRGVVNEAERMDAGAFGEMMSEASWRAIASAIWLRTQLPMHTKRTFTGSGMG